MKTIITFIHLKVVDEDKRKNLMDSLTNALKGSAAFLNIVWTKVIGENQISTNASNE